MFTNLKIFVLLVSILYLFVSGCSAQGWHEGLRSGNTIHCNQLPPSEYDDCVDQAGGGYKDYVKERGRIVSDK